MLGENGRKNLADWDILAKTQGTTHRELSKEKRKKKLKR